MVSEITTLRASIPDGLRNLADAIERGEYEPQYLVWALHEEDGMVSGALGLCSDADAHFLMAQAQRYLEGCYSACG